MYAFPLFHPAFHFQRTTCGFVRSTQTPLHVVPLEQSAWNTARGEKTGVTRNTGRQSEPPGMGPEFPVIGGREPCRMGPVEIWDRGRVGTGRLRRSQRHRGRGKGLPANSRSSPRSRCPRGHRGGVRRPARARRRRAIDSGGLSPARQSLPRRGDLPSAWASGRTRPDFAPPG